MSRIEIGRFSDNLRKMFSMAGVSDVSRELSPEISPTVDLTSPAVEWPFLRDERVIVGTNSMAAVVGLPATWELHNPVNSGTMAIIEGLFWSPGIDSDGVMVLNETSVAPVRSFPIIRDTRLANINTTPTTVDISAMQMRRGNIVLGGSLLWQGRISSFAPNWMPWPFVLTPGFTLGGSVTTLNVSLRATILWRERMLPALEA